MGLFSKKEEPRLPEVRSHPIGQPRIGTPPRDEELKVHELPSFPNDEFSDKIAQQAIKDNVYEGHSKPMHMELDEDSEDNLRTIEINERVSEESSTKTVSPTKPIFVRLDKFNNGISNLNQIKKTVSMLDQLTSDLKEIKDREEKELRDLENEIQEIKTRLNLIEQDVFNQVG